ncbi:MAG: hypothetical protein Ct9H90mP8_0080 [Pseudomonadota bacterium]|nr:MAG: hypothetical protein Ct9H90mP8_0080 [Pseudomonadota bacterium]
MKVQNCWQSGGRVDYHYLYSPKEAQMNAFREQLELAEELDLPFWGCIPGKPSRIPWISLKNSLLPGKGLPIVSPAPGKWQKNWSRWDGISDQGIVTFKNAEDLRQVVLHTPLESLLLETDSPYPFTRSFPWKTECSGKGFGGMTFVAELLGMEETELAKQTTQNAQELFGSF